MLKPVQESGPDPPSTQTALDPLDNGTDSTEAAPSETGVEAGAQEGRDTSVEETDHTQIDKTHVDDSLQQAAETVEPSDKTDGLEVDQGSKAKPPSELTLKANKDPGTEEQKSKKTNRRFPSKKAMVDPLKMDMTKPLVMPLTSSELSLQCIECHIIFSDTKSKQRHLKLSHPVEYEQCMLRNSLFTCYHCDSHFTNSTELMAHQKTHVDRKPFKCPLCGQAFKRLFELTHHKKVHVGQDGYTCPECGKICKTITLLKYHSRVHTGEKPYVCKECGSRFSMSHALQKHLQSHLPEGAQEREDAKTKAQRKKELDALAPKYPCSVCKATFKSPKTRLRHLTNKHSVSLNSLGKPVRARSHLNHLTPVITPISVAQTSLLQLEPNGPLQKVDGNIDTEPIRRLIESLGNVQKVNQVVILGQVPPHAPPLEVQQISELSKPVNLNLKLLQSHSVELTPVESKTMEGDFSNNSCDPMEQTIILEPITPDGQLINPPLSDFGETRALGLAHNEHRLEPYVEVTQHIHPQPEMNATNSNTLNPLVFHNEGTDPKQDLEQTFILELTPALTPTAEQQQSEISTPSLVPTTQLEKTPYQSIVNEHDTGSPIESSEPIVEQHLTSLQSAVPLSGPAFEQNLTSLPVNQQDPPTSPLASSQAPAQASGEPQAKSQEKAQSQVQKVTQVEVHSLADSGTPQESQEKTTQGEELLLDPKQDMDQGQSPSDVMDASVKKDPSHSSSKPKPQTPELPMNVMSAQELVKVRKRKPARALIIQGYMQELIGSILDEDLQSNGKPAKRKRTKKSHLVNLSPQKKEKKNKKQGVPSQQCQPAQEEPVIDAATKVLENKVPSKKKGRIATKSKKANTSSSEVNMSSLTKDSQGKEKISKKKKKKEKNMLIDKHKSKQKPAIKKKIQPKIVQKGHSKSTKVTKFTKKGRKKTEETVSPKNNQTKDQAESPGAQVTQDSLLLLKGHKQPQLKVHKLDPSKTSAQEISPRDNPSQHSADNQASPKTKTAKNPTNVGKKKGKSKTSQKTLSLLSFLNTAHQSPKTQLAKPKTVRKRKASSNVETEGVITAAHSKRALECKNCGEIFNEVASLQKHKAMVHILESPELTYTNGNIFEGVSRLDVDHQGRVMQLVNPTTGWDNDPDMVIEDRERSVSFPTLNPSPSLPADEGNIQPPNSQKLLDLTKNSKTSHLDPLFESTTQMEQNKSVASIDKEQERMPCLESEHQAPIEEDIKEDAILEVDLVTVGERNESNTVALLQDNLSQRESVEDANSEASSFDQAKVVSTLQSVSCSTQQVGVKDEEEELLVQKDKKAGKRRGVHRKVDVMSRKCLEPGGTAFEVEQEDCQVIHEKTEYNSQIDDEDETIAKTSLTDPGPDPHRGPSIIPAPPSSPEKSNVAQEAPDRESQPSPGIYLEKIVTAEPGLAKKRRDLTAENETQAVIKVEDSTSDPLVGAHACQKESGRSEARMRTQQNRDIRTVLVKQESRVMLNDARSTPDSEQRQWNVEKVADRNSVSPFSDSEDTSSDCRISPDLSSKQCIFYPVKVEEREVPLDAVHTNGGSPEASTGVRQTLHPTTACHLYPGTQQDYHDMRGPEMMDVDDVADGQEAECPNQPDMRSFLLQTSDEERIVELSQPHVDAEIEVLAYFGKNQGSQQPDVTTQTVFKTATREPSEPLEYFSRYFGWDTWVEIARCTNQTSDYVTAREVAQFVGIHIAMGTLKFPSPRLYWDNLTKVPLIAETMPLSRFLQLSRLLKLASPAKDPHTSNMRERTRIDRSGQRGLSDDSEDLLWKVAPLLCRFQKGCQSLGRQGDFAVDQYLIPLTGKVHNDRLALHSTTLIGFEGFLLHVDLKADLSGKEDTIEKITPKGSTVFLCKQELSTPAMLERLLEAGIHGAGRVGGAQGQIGDEFVSSDGKLMLRRSHYGFILSTAGNGHKNMASLISNFEKAQAAARLNRDLLNLYSVPVAFSPTGWPLVVLWYLTDMALVNSWLLHRHDHMTTSAPLSFMDFRLAVSKALIHSSGSDPQNSVLPQSSPTKAHTKTDPPNPGTVEESPLPDAATRYDGSGHWPEQLAEGEGGRCRFGDCQRTSRVLCLKCCVFLCISRNHNCFLNFHNQASSGNL
ncbi:zinc finger protein 576, tandem duplicate 1 isoform X2 [Vanacampus margaritifer]